MPEVLVRSGNLRFCVGLPKVPLVAIRGNSLRVCLTKGSVLASMILATGGGGGDSMEAPSSRLPWKSICPLFSPSI